jgi:hypothetical protein
MKGPGNPKISGPSFKFEISLSGLVPFRILNFVGGSRLVALLSAAALNEFEVPLAVFHLRDELAFSFMKPKFFNVVTCLLTCIFKYAHIFNCNAMC